MIEFLNGWGDRFLTFIVPMLWQSSLLIVVVGALDYLLARKIRAAVRHALWLVVLVKLLLPPALALPTGAAWWLSRSQPAIKAPAIPKTTVSYGSIVVAPEVEPLMVAAPEPVQPSLDRAGWALLASGVVSGALLCWLAGRWWQVTRVVRRALPDDALNEELAAARSIIGSTSRVELKLVAGRMSPAVCGWLRPVILLPEALSARLSPVQLRAVLLHELLHLRRGDLWVNGVQALLQVTYWWHPLLWMANARVRRLREEAVDDAVMLALRDDAENYAPTLLEVARLALQRPRLSLGLVGIMESRSALRQRIERLLDFHAPRRAGVTFAAWLGIGIFSAVALPMGQAPARFEPTPISASVNLRVSNMSDNLIAPPISSWQMASVANDFPGRSVPSRQGIIADPQFREALAALSPDQLLSKSPAVRTTYSGRSINRIGLTISAAQMKTNSTDVVVESQIQTSTTQAVPIASDVPLALPESANEIKREVAAVNSSTADDGRAQLESSLLDSTDSQAVLVPRTYKLDQRAFIAYHLKQTGVSLVEGSHFGQTVAAAAKEDFQRLGVDWGQPTGKSIIYNAHNGLLLVWATLADLEVIDQVVKMVNFSPPQIYFKARYFSVPERRFAKLLEPFGITNAETVMLDHANGAAFLIALRAVSGSENKGEPEATTTDGMRCRVMSKTVVTIVTNMALMVADQQNASGNYADGTTLMNDINSPVSTNQNSAPGGYIKPQTTQLECGVSADYVAKVTQDRQGVELNLSVQDTEFFGYRRPRHNWLGYTYPSTNVVYTLGGDKISLPEIAPVIWTRQARTITLLNKEQYLVMFPQAAPQDESQIKNKLIVVITVMPVDASGNSLAENMKRRTQVITGAIERE